MILQRTLAQLACADLGRRIPAWTVRVMPELSPYSAAPLGRRYTRDNRHMLPGRNNAL
jgi:hypothetical protein